LSAWEASPARRSRNVPESNVQAHTVIIAPGWFAQPQIWSLNFSASSGSVIGLVALPNRPNSWVRVSLYPSLMAIGTVTAGSAPKTRSGHVRPALALAADGSPRHRSSCPVQPVAGEGRNDEPIIVTGDMSCPFRHRLSGDNRGGCPISTAWSQSAQFLQSPTRPM
jgi:hypothetical protein